MSTAPAETRRARSDSVVWVAMRRFVAIALVALGLVAVGSVLVARSISRDVAVGDAVSRGHLFAVGVSAPLVDDGVLAGDTASLQTFQTVMENRLREGSIRHIKVWSSDGVVLWSDEPEVNGRQFELEPEVRRLFATGGTVGSLAPLDRPENAGEQGEGPLLEVYAAAASASGRRVVVETYWTGARLDDDANHVMLRSAPLALGSLLTFSLLIFPLAWTLARRVERTRDENTLLVRRSLAASELERTRIARDLHDGVMQDVSGAGYALSAAVCAMRDESLLPRRLVGEVVDLLRRVGDSLRSTLVDIYPTDLRSTRLVDAVEELAARTRRSGPEVRVEVRLARDEQLEVVQLCYRFIREGLRNVERHADATRVEVRLRTTGDTVRVSVSDDGRGLSALPEDGHLGLRLLRGTMRDIGGALEVGPGLDGRGTTLAATFPRSLGST